jgi:hypothetical protein
MPTTVASVWAKSGQGFPVLIHDSSLFADVDPRQYGSDFEARRRKFRKVWLPAYLLPECWIAAT